ncbi:hypothetical protein [Pontibacter burrus]|uniref:Uncharacterized protein n=1 Tax=Pontibacter burrus TaxID=2704466 RepID=A0A6B3LRQ1_9BACT|nr:hypothetical protein [Pontibacter burrus]NEM96174.1 hypothetical protein [Pontibacter burrus]
MIRYTLNGEKRTCKTQWHEVTLGEYLQVLLAESDTEAVSVLTGLSTGELQQAGEQVTTLLEAAQMLLASEPSGHKPAWLMLDLGQDNVGKLELCRHYLREHAVQSEQAYPYLYAVYAWPEQYNRLLAISGAGFPAPLVEKAKALPVTETVGALAHILSENERLIERYKPILAKEPTEEQLMAGIGKFEKYGFLPTLLNKAGHVPADQEAVLDTPAYAFYQALCIDTERGEYEEKYHKILSEKQ